MAGRVGMIPWESSETTAKVVASYVKALNALEDVIKNKQVNAGQMKYAFADLSAVRDAIQPACAANGLGVSQSASDNGVQTILLHESGEWLAFPPLNIGVAQNTPQAQGSAISFARRYSLLAAFNIATEDDDGQGAAKAPRATRAASPRAPTETQQQRAQILAKEVGLTDRADRLFRWSEWLGRAVGSFNDLTAQEATAVIDRMETMKREGA